MKVIHNTNKNNELDDFWWSKLETLVENGKFTSQFFKTHIVY